MRDEKAPDGTVKHPDRTQEPDPDEREERPRVVVEVPGYWALPEEERKKIDELMKRRAAERDAKKKQKPEEK